MSMSLQLGYNDPYFELFQSSWTLSIRAQGRVRCRAVNWSHGISFPLRLFLPSICPVIPIVQWRDIFTIQWSVCRVKCGGLKTAVNEIQQKKKKFETLVGKFI